jgi:two-component system LytT family response regulator
MQLNAIIVDDEKLSRDLLQAMIKDLCPNINVVAEASNSGEAKEAIENLNPDAVFMDIEIEDGNGLDFLSQFQTHKKFQTVYVTAHNKYSIRALKAEATDYLLKPLDASELVNTTEKLYKNHINGLRSNMHHLSQSLNTRLILPHFSGYKIVSLKDIVHLDADNHYTYVHTLNEPVTLLSKSIKYFEEKLDNFWFFRPHKSHIINFYHFKEYLSVEGGYAVMCNGKKLPVSRYKLEEFLEYANILGIRI